MRFGIITPVFDACLESLELLYQELMLQTHHDWLWMLCSNGFSEALSRFVTSRNGINYRDHSSLLHRRRLLLYLHTAHETTGDVLALLENIGRRRARCIREIDADYIFMIDADAKILDKEMFQEINSELERSHKSICIYKIKHEIGVLPIFPIGFARIDMLNFCVRADLAKKVGYPISARPETFGNDYWYFDRAYKASGGDYVFIDKIFCEHNGNSRYESLLKLRGKEINAAAEVH